MPLPRHLLAGLSTSLVMVATLLGHPATQAAAATPASTASTASTGEVAPEVGTTERRTLELKNPSFEAGTRHWRAASAQLRSVRAGQVPDGVRHGEVTWTKRGRSRSVHYVAPVSSEVGDRLVARVHVSAGNRAARRDRVFLKVTELVDGRIVARGTSEPRRLRGSYRPLTVARTITHADSSVRLRVRHVGVRKGARLLVDGATVSVTPAAPEQPTQTPTEPTEPTTDPTTDPTTAPTEQPTEEPTQPTEQPSLPTGTSLGLLSIREGQAPHWGDTSRYSYVVGYGWEHRRVATVKAANPQTDMLLYLEAGATQYRDDCATVSNPLSFQRPRASWGIDFCWLLANGHEDWILRDGQGRYLEYHDYPGFLAMDMANPEYAAQWAVNAAEAVRMFGFDGVWADDVNTAIGHGHRVAYRATRTGPVQISDAQYGAGALDWVRRVDAAWSRTADDLTLAANVYAVAWEEPGATQALAMAEHLDIYSREHQTQWLTGHQCDPKRAQEPNAINDTMRYAERIQATGADYVAIDYGTDPISARDRQIMSFGRSMWLMTWNGSPGGAYFYRPCGFVDAADPAWTTELGTPTGPREALRTERFVRPGDRWESTGHLLRRDFTHGIVLQNQLPHPVTVPLDGRYRTPEGQVVESVTLPGSQPATSTSEGLPGSAALLTKVD